MRTLLAALAFALPLVALGAESGPSFRAFTEGVVRFVNGSVLPLLYALAFLFFVYGMVRFFFIQGAEGREEGKQVMLWGIIGLFVLFSVWGLVNMVLATFGLDA